MVFQYQIFGHNIFNSGVCVWMQLNIKCWMDNQHLTRWRCLSSTQGQVRETISGPSPGAKTRLLYFNTIKYRVVTGLLAGHNSLRKMGLNSSPLCRRCGVQDETSVHNFCECEAKASHSHMYIWVPFSWIQRTLSVKVWGHLEVQQTNRAPLN